MTELDSAGIVRVVEPTGVVAPNAVLKMNVPGEVDVSVTASPTVVGVPVAVCSCTVMGPTDSRFVLQAGPVAGAVMNFNFEGRGGRLVCWRSRSAGQRPKRWSSESVRPVAVIDRYRGDVLEVVSLLAPVGVVEFLVVLKLSVPVS